MQPASSDRELQDGTRTAAPLTPAPSQTAPASSAPVDPMPIPRNSLPSTFPFLEELTGEPDVPIWTFLSADASVPEPNAFCALLVSPAALEVARATVPWIRSGGAGSGPVVRGQDNFEIRPSAGKGLGMFATKDLAKGAVVFEEQPVFVGDLGLIAVEEREAVLQYAFSHLLPDIQKAILALCAQDTARPPLSERYWTNVFEQVTKWDPDAERGSYNGLYLTMSRYATAQFPL